MTLLQFLQVLRRRALSIAIVTVVAGLLSAGWSLTLVPQYASTANIFVSVDGGSTVNDLSQGNTFSEARVKSYVSLAVTPRVLSQAARRVSVPGGADRLVQQVTASAEPDTVIISVRAQDTNPRRAADIANAVSDVLVSTVERIEVQRSDGTALVHLSVVQPAPVQPVPVSPRIPVNIVIGVLLGAMLGIAQAVLRNVLDTRVRGIDSLRQLTGASVLVSFASDDAAARPLLDAASNHSPRAEGFRQLRTHLGFTNLDGGSQSILVTSSVPGEGKTSTSVNLALMLAQNGHRVILVDADLRRPAVGTSLGIESRVGLSSVLTRQVEVDDAIQSVGGGATPLDVLAAGAVPPNPSELLSSPAMTALLEHLGERYEHVIVDSPPLVPVTDPAVLGPQCSGVLLVASVDGRVKRAEFLRALDDLDRADARMLGVVVNRAPEVRNRRSYYNYAPTRPVSESPRRSSRSRAVDDVSGGDVDRTVRATRGSHSST